MDERVSQTARGLLAGVWAACGRRGTWFVGSLLVAALSSCPAPVFALGSVTLAWDANTEPDIAGYTVYYRSEDNFSHGTMTVAAGQTTATLGSLRSAIKYYFSVSAFDSMGIA